jgi:hypothetical protein
MLYMVALMTGSFQLVCNRLDSFDR